VKADQKARGRYLGGKVPFGFRRGDDGELVSHEAEQEAIREMIALRAQGKALRVIAAAAQARGHQISHEGVAGVFKGVGRSDRRRWPARSRQFTETCCYGRKTKRYGSLLEAVALMGMAGALSGRRGLLRAYRRQVEGANFSAAA
jgi:hypothetical protein